MAQFATRGASPSASRASPFLRATLVTSVRRIRNGETSTSLWSEPERKSPPGIETHSEVDAAAGWVAYWDNLTLPLTGQDLLDAQAILAGWDDSASPQGGLGDR